MPPLPHPKKEERDYPKPAADTQSEYSCDYLFSPSLEAVTENMCKNFVNYTYCW